MFLFKIKIILTPEQFDFPANYGWLL